LILPEVLDFCRLRKQKDYIAVKMGKHGKELTIADKQTIISMIVFTRIADYNVNPKNANVSELFFVNMVEHWKH
jgi:hypothetical protein